MSRAGGYRLNGLGELYSLTELYSIRLRHGVEHNVLAGPALLARLAKREVALQVHLSFCYVRFVAYVGPNTKWESASGRERKKKRNERKPDRSGSLEEFSFHQLGSMRHISQRPGHFAVVVAWLLLLLVLCSC